MTSWIPNSNTGPSRGKWYSAKCWINVPHTKWKRVQETKISLTGPSLNHTQKLISSHSAPWPGRSLVKTCWQTISVLATLCWGRCLHVGVWTSSQNRLSGSWGNAELLLYIFGNNKIINFCLNSRYLISRDLLLYGNSQIAHERLLYVESTCETSEGASNKGFQSWLHKKILSWNFMWSSEIIYLNTSW